MTSTGLRALRISKRTLQDLTRASQPRSRCLHNASGIPSLQITTVTCSRFGNRSDELQQTPSASLVQRRYVRQWKKEQHDKKMQKDNKGNVSKTVRISSMVRGIRGAVFGAQGETDPKKNKELAKIIESFKDVDQEYVQRALANTKSVTEPMSIFVQAKSGIQFVIDGYTGTSTVQIKNQLNSTFRKSKFMAEIVDLDPNFERKGVIVVDLPVNGKNLTEEEATNIAIEIGAEDVAHEEDCLRFICGAKEWIDPQKALKELGMDPSSAGVEFVPVEGDVFTEKQIDEYQNAVDKFQYRVQNLGLPFMVTQIADNIVGVKDEPT